MAVFSCTYCRFSIRPRVAFLSIDYCPRCLARRRVAVPLRVTEEPDSQPRTHDPSASNRWSMSRP
jgi:hypothetical protein